MNPRGSEWYQRHSGSCLQERERRATWVSSIGMMKIPLLYRSLRHRHRLCSKDSEVNALYTSNGNMPVHMYCTRRLPRLCALKYVVSVRSIYDNRWIRKVIDLDAQAASF